MDGENIITWNFANWITIILMGVVFFALFGFAARVFHAQRTAGTPDQATTV